jgi:hypothetical protein
LAKANSSRREDQRRRTVLTDFAKRPGGGLTQKACRSLGDAYFAIFAPADSVILTTNVKDHAPLAEALKKKAVAPE